MLHTVEVRGYWRRVTAMLACWTTLPGPQMEVGLHLCPAHRLSMAPLTKEDSLDNAYLGLLPGHTPLCSHIPPPHPRILTTWLTFVFPASWGFCAGWFLCARASSTFPYPLAVSSSLFASKSPLLNPRLAYVKCG